MFCRGINAAYFHKPSFLQEKEFVSSDGFLAGGTYACVLASGAGSHLSERQVQCQVVGFGLSMDVFPFTS